MSRHRVTPLRRIINPPIDPWSTLIDGPWTELIEGSLYETLQQSASEDTKPEFDGYFGRPDNDDPETEEQR